MNPHTHESAGGTGELLYATAHEKAPDLFVSVLDCSTNKICTHASVKAAITIQRLNNHPQWPAITFILVRYVMGDDLVRPRASSNSAMISFHNLMDCLLLSSSLWPHVANNYDYNTILLGGYEDSFDNHCPGLNIYAHVSDFIDHTLQVLLSLGNY